MKAIIAVLLFVCCSVSYSEQFPQRPQIETKRESKGSIQYKQKAQEAQSQLPATQPPIPNSGNAAEDSENGNNKGTEFWSPFLGFQFKITDSLLVLFTAILAIFTGFLWGSTKKLWQSGERSLTQTERAFVFLDGFNVELTTAKDANTSTDYLPEEYKFRPEFYITRFAVQPRWKNSGNTPVRNMSIRINWLGPRGPEEIIFPDYEFRDGSATRLFIGPNAIEPSEFIEIPSVRELINWGLYPTRVEPKVFVWGRADYADIFGRDHFIQWCYRIRLEDHKGEGRIRAGFIQWGDYNSSDEDQNT